MSSTHKQAFLRYGYLQLRGFYPRSRLAGLRQKVLEEVKRSSARPGISKSLPDLPVFQQISRLSSLVKVRDVHETLVTPELMDLVAEVGGQSPSVVQDTQLLLSPPRQGTWTLKDLNWHVDLAVDPRHRDRVPGVQAFFLIDDVDRQGGGTLALAGSHRLGAAGSNAAARLRQVLRAQADLERELQELGVSIVEMCGRAGDVFLMDMRVLHTPSINSSKRLRMMATCRFLFGRV